MWVAGWLDAWYVCVPVCEWGSVIHVCIGMVSGK